MGRSNTSKKRRAKGKKGWAKIDVSQDIPQMDTEPLFYIDTQEKKLSKKQRKLLAQQSLLSTGHSINTTPQPKIDKNKLKQIKSENKKIIKNYKNSNFVKNMPKNKQTKSQKMKSLNNSSTYNVINSKAYDLWNENEDKIDKNIKNEKILNNLGKNKKKIDKYKLSKMIKNKYVPQSIGISLPMNGESVNPVKFDYYQLNYKANKLKYRQMFYKLWQNKKTRDWHKNIWGKIEKNEKKLEYFSRKWKQERLKYLKSKQKWIKNIKKIKDKNDKIKNVERQIITDKNDEINNNNLLRSKSMNKMKYNGYGMNYKKIGKWNKLNKEMLIGKNMRNNVGTKTENAVSWMFNELRQQNRIQPKKRIGKYIRRRTTFLGPRFKVQTRIGKLFHANVNDNIHTVMDE